MQQDQAINLEELTIGEFYALTAERGIRPTVLLAAYELQRESIEH